MIDIVIRQETAADQAVVYALVKEAFRGEEQSDHLEQELVDNLRRSESFIPELSLVAELDGVIVGHILVTRIKIRNDEASFDSLALAPVSVLPEYQRQDIGGKLIRAAHKIARELGHESVVLVGHKDYYPRFGYRLCELFDIKIPFDAPPEYCMAIELTPNALKHVSGTVVYDPAFGIE